MFLLPAETEREGFSQTKYLTTCNPTSERNVNRGCDDSRTERDGSGVPLYRTPVPEVGRSVAGIPVEELSTPTLSPVSTKLDVENNDEFIGSRGVVTGMERDTGVSTAESAGSAPGVSSIDQLDSEADFHFTYFTDIWGLKPVEGNPMVKRVEDWILESGSEFAVTSGDHLTAPRDGYTDQFNEYIADPDRSPDFWREDFYVNTADHDVQYYTGPDAEAGQDNWGASWPFLEDAGLYDRDNVEFADERYDWYDEWLSGIDVDWEWWDGLEGDYPEEDKLAGHAPDYYAQVERGGVTFHLVLGHHAAFGDVSPTGFPEQTKRFIAETVSDIDKGDDDVVITTAQSWSGNFVDQLSLERQREVVGTADFVLSGNQHEVAYYDRTSREYLKWNDEPDFDYTDHPEFPAVALALNGGSPHTGTHPGYFDIHVFTDPLRFTVQYIDTTTDERTLQRGPTGLYDTWPMRKVAGGPYEAITDWENWDN
jgi:hypothetical protein